MATKPPKDILSDRKVSGMMDDLLEDTNDCMDTSAKLARGATLRASSSIKSNVNSGVKVLGDLMEKSETERGVILDGKAKDTRNLKGLVQKQLDALTGLETLNGQVEVMEDAAIAAMITSLVGTFALIAGPGLAFKKLQKDIISIRNTLLQANRIARDTKVKAAIGAAIAAATVAAGPMTIPVALGAFGGGLLVDKVLDSVLAGRPDSTTKTAWGYGTSVAAGADALDKMPKGFGPLLDIANTTVDISECFAAESDRKAIIKQIDTFLKEFEKARAKFSSEAAKIDKAVKEAQRTLATATAAVQAFKPAKGSAHGVLRYL